MNTPPSNFRRLRLETLLAIPDAKRTDAEWDELNELEISLALSNNEKAPGQGAGHSGGAAPVHQKPKAWVRSKSPRPERHRHPPKNRG